MSPSLLLHDQIFVSVMEEDNHSHYHYLRRAILGFYSSQERIPRLNCGLFLIPNIAASRIHQFFDPRHWREQATAAEDVLQTLYSRLREVRDNFTRLQREIEERQVWCS